MNFNLTDHTLFCTSYNRPKSLKILVKYLEDLDYNGKLLLIDASSKPLKTTITQKKFVNYWHMPGVSFVNAISQSHQFIKTQYVTLIGDDDFPHLQGVYDALEKMRFNPEINSCSGNSVWLYYPHLINEKTASSQHMFYNFLLKHKVDQRNIEITGSKYKVINDMIDNYRVTQFYVMKKNIWIKTFNQKFAEIEDKALGEIASSLNIALSLPHATVNSIFLMRGTGHNRPTADPLSIENSFPDLSKARRQVHKYFGTLGFTNEVLDALVASSICIRIGHYIPGFLRKQYTREAIKTSMEKRLNDLRSDSTFPEAIKILLNANPST